MLPLLYLDGITLTWLAQLPMWMPVRVVSRCLTDRMLEALQLPVRLVPVESFWVAQVKNDNVCLFPAHHSASILPSILTINFVMFLVCHVIASNSDSVLSNWLSRDCSHYCSLSLFCFCEMVSLRCHNLSHSLSYNFKDNGGLAGMWLWAVILCSA